MVTSSRVLEASASVAQWKCQLAMSTNRENGMHQLAWRKNKALDQAKVRLGIIKLTTNDAVVACWVPVKTDISRPFILGE